MIVKRVEEAIRILGATFFQEMTGNKTVNKTKVYSASALRRKKVRWPSRAQEEQAEEDFLDCLLGEGDEDATLVADFEAAETELIQEDGELAAAYNAYAEARKRLSDKVQKPRFLGDKSRRTTTVKGQRFLLEQRCLER